MASALDKNIGAITSLLSLFTDKKSTRTVGGGTTTRTAQTKLSDEAVAGALQSILESDQGGIARISSGEKAAGLYNTASRTLMLNDLLARAAAQTEAIRAPKVETTVTPTVTATEKTPAALDPTKALLAAGGIYLASEKGRKKVGDIWDSIFGTGTAEFSPSGAADFATDLPIASAAGTFGPMSTVGGDYGTTYSLFGGGGATTGGSDLVTSALSLAADVLTGSVGSALGVTTTTSPTYVSTDYEKQTGNVRPSGSPVTGGGGVITGGCFITTAVCALSGRADDCYELQALRNFRDTWLKDNYPEDIVTYYAEAPAIVEQIGAREDAAAIYHQLDRDYIQPAVEAVEVGAYEIAYSIYRNMFLYAKEIANG
jgi:hypothetical protein